jgi:hypothetical protein
LLSYQSHCKDCGRAYIREHYKQNKEYYLEKNDRKRERVVEFIREAKSKPCADCGRAYPYYVMDFDHRVGEKKSHNVHDLIRAASFRQLHIEIAKCDVVCANCHRQRTFMRRESGKG